MPSLVTDTLQFISVAALRLAEQKLLRDIADSNSLLHIPSCIQLGLTKSSNDILPLAGYVKDLRRRFPIEASFGEIPSFCWDGYPTPHAEDIGELLDAQQSVGKLQVNATSIQVAVVVVLKMLIDQLSVPIEMVSPL